MSMASPHTTLRRPRISALATPRTAHPLSGPESRVEVLENRLLEHNPELASAVIEEVHRALRNEGLGTVQVRFGVCRDDEEGLRFICKVENPPRRDSHPADQPWRWWSPLMETLVDFQAALAEGLRIRRERLAGGR
jgi:hypothetical protein